MYDRERLATLSAVVDEGGFEQAAARLHVTPSAVSQRIKALERQAGQVLVRRTRPCRATDAGQALLRLSRQIVVLEGEVGRSLGDPDTATHLPIAVNADSVTDWFLDALTPLVAGYGVRLDLHVDDEERTAELLRGGTVVGAVTTAREAVQGCVSEPLGSTRYRPVATPELAARWFDGRDPATAFPAAPRVDFGPKDHLQTRLVRTLTHRPCTGPAHRVPAADGYHAAVRAGLGWGMFTDPNIGDLVLVGGDRYLDVPLYWQHWRLRTTVLDELADSVRRVASRALA